MASYVKHIWECGEEITADLLNHIENGIESAGEGGSSDSEVFYVDITPTTGGYQANKTATEIYQAYNEGKVIKARTDSIHELGVAIADLTGVKPSEPMYGNYIEIRFFGIEGATYSSYQALETLRIIITERDGTQTVNLDSGIIHGGALVIHETETVPCPEGSEGTGITYFDASYQDMSAAMNEGIPVYLEQYIEGDSRTSYTRSSLIELIEFETTGGGMMYQADFVGGNNALLIADNDTDPMRVEDCGGK